MSEERLATALERAGKAAQRIEAAIASMSSRSSDQDDAAGDSALRAAVAPILAELDAMIADAERAQG